MAGWLVAFSITSSNERPRCKNFDKVVGIESRGFIFASAIAYKMSKPLILIRKKNKLPSEKYSEDFELEYGKATIEMHKDSIKKNEKVIESYLGRGNETNGEKN